MSISTTNEIEKRLANVLDVHFDPTWGAPFWLEQSRALTFDPGREIRTIADLERFGPFPAHELAKRPVEDFIPKRFHDQLVNFVTSESGGTTGSPARTAFRQDEFEAAFVTPFVEAAKVLDFPRGIHWLFIGPSGPHVIGKGARACAHALGSMDPFMVDFDPRWVRKLPSDSMARGRYVEHVLEQAEAVLRTQSVGVLFSTPPILEALGQRLEESIRNAITGIHLGGIAAKPEFWPRLSAEWFPNAKYMSGYGNSLMGVCPQVAVDSTRPPEYFPHGNRLILEVVDTNSENRGRVRFHRLDESAFMPNVIERDEAELIALPTLPPSTGFALPGARDPKPTLDSVAKLSQGLY